MKRLAVTLLLLASACVVPPAAAPTPQPVTVNASYDRTWNAVIDAFAEMNVPIANMEKASGFIASDRIALTGSNEDRSALADCGQAWGAPVPPTHLKYNVRVRSDSSSQGRSAVIISTFFQRDLGTFSGTRVPPTDCASRGVVDSLLVSKIRSRAQGQP